MKISFLDLIAHVCANIVKVFGRKHYFTACKNISSAFPQYNIKEVEKTAYLSLKNLSLTILEILYYYFIPNIHNKIPLDIEGESELKEIAQNGGIIASFHMGNWELLNICGANRFDSWTVIVKKQKNKIMSRIIDSFRAKNKVNVVFAESIKDLLRNYNTKKVLATMFDRGFTDSKINVIFLGKKVPVPFIFFKMARKYNQKIYPACISRINGRHKVRISSPLDIISFADDQACAQQLSDVFESFVKLNPVDYIWSYKRDKVTTSKKMMILSDAKPGHVNQSRAVAALAVSAEANLSIDEVEIKLSRIKRIFSDLVVHLPKFILADNFLILKMLVGDKTTKLLANNFIVSAGSSLSSLNLIISKISSAKSICIMRPVAKRKSFDLIISPEHDNLKPAKNICSIQGAVSYVTNEKFLSDCELYRREFGLKENCKYFSLFIGGALSSDFKNDELESLFNKLKDYADRNKLIPLITTSRRTPKILEEMIIRIFTDSPKVIASEKNYPFTVYGMLSNSLFAISSADSVSMISEASSVVPTFIVDIFSVFKNSAKHFQFAQKLEKSGIAKIVNYSTLDKSLDAFGELQINNSKTLILNALKRNIL